MDELKKTLEIITLLRLKCPADIIRDSKNLIMCLREEIGEIEEALKNDDDENLKEEIGDVLFSLLFLVKVVEEKGFDLKDILNKVNNKMVFRHPHVFADPRSVSIEEAGEIWKEQKRKEREDKIIH